MTNGDSTPHTNGESNVLQPQNKNTTPLSKKIPPSSKNDPKDDSANDEHETDTEDTGEDGGKQPKKKLKRGRKLKVLKDNNDASLKKKKPRKTPNKNNKKSMNQSMTSDEDEECSASNCSRPPGNLLSQT